MRSVLIRAIVSALLMAAAQAHEGLSFLVWIGAAPLLHLALAGSKKQVIWGTALAGLIYYGCTTIWLCHITYFAWLGMAGILACLCGILGAWWAFARESRCIPVWISLPAAWMGITLLRGHLGAFAFPWVYLSHSQVRATHLIQITEIIGGEGLDGLIILFNLCLVMAFNNWKKHPQDKKALAFPLAGAAFLLAALYILGIFLSSSVQTPPGPVIAAIQANIPTEVKQQPMSRNEILQKHIRMTRRACRLNPDLVVWPETMVPADLNTDLAIRDYLESFSAEIRTPLLVGAHHGAGEAEDFLSYNSAYFIDPDKGLQWRYDKVHLVPFGEYLPLSRHLAFIGGLASDNAAFLAGRDLLPHPALGLAIGVNICFEATLEGLVYKQVKNGAQLIINLTNDGWYKTSRELEHHFAATVFRAIETRIALIRVTNTGISSVIGPNGEILHRLADPRAEVRAISGILCAEIPLGPGPRVPRTLRLGLLFAWILAGLAACVTNHIKQKERKIVTQEC